ncbi:hypothetical protein Ait01nite_074160 [Actinoplanes italicus]|uniref:Uncharacterized protein n=1 Tax=Actinoplanes italicus TaxID=113567 RepID=A0A2T0K162_9ACTN|nr:hypothetical protein [Actinoplanes italicus]PRX16295.1 hypothetical protein CLV67_120110 [Actinoplanes italicus]GIE34371.1 hypothetical protein Ait01nite_074160 [Actinoplanes italicus]
MTGISSVSASTGQYSYLRSPVAAQRRENLMSRVADTLGMTVDDLRSRLDDGHSLNELATARGVPHEDLILAIRAGLSAGDPEAFAARRGTPPPAPPAREPRGENAGLRDEVKLRGVSRLLGMDGESVTTAATGAAALVTLMQDKGIDLYALRGVLTSGDLIDVTV